MFILFMYYICYILAEKNTSIEAHVCCKLNCFRFEGRDQTPGFCARNGSTKRFRDFTRFFYVSFGFGDNKAARASEFVLFESTRSHSRFSLSNWIKTHYCISYACTNCVRCWACATSSSSTQGQPHVHIFVTKQTHSNNKGKKPGGSFLSVFRASRVKVKCIMKTVLQHVAEIIELSTDYVSLVVVLLCCKRANIKSHHRFATLIIDVHRRAPSSRARLFVAMFSGGRE